LAAHLLPTPAVPLRRPPRPPPFPYTPLFRSPVLRLDQPPRVGDRAAVQRQRPPRRPQRPRVHRGGPAPGQRQRAPRVHLHQALVHRTTTPPNSRLECTPHPVLCQNQTLVHPP